MSEDLTIKKAREDQEIVFDIDKNMRQKIKVNERTFIVTLKSIKKLEIKDVENPLEFEFMIAEVENK